MNKQKTNETPTIFYNDIILNYFKLLNMKSYIV